jgi:hypothetical protein
LLVELGRQSCADTRETRSGTCACPRITAISNSKIYDVVVSCLSNEQPIASFVALPYEASDFEFKHSDTLFEIAVILGHAHVPDRDRRFASVYA